MKYGLLLVAFLSMGCEHIAPLLTSVLSAADLGQRVYFNRHPSPRQALVEAALETMARCNARQDQECALGAYEAAYKLLVEEGVIDAVAPDGGAETDAPTPHVSGLPTPEELREQLR